VAVHNISALKYARLKPQTPHTQNRQTQSTTMNEKTNDDTK